jgi:hypothetical protein
MKASAEYCWDALYCDEADRGALEVSSPALGA